MSSEIASQGSLFTSDFLTESIQDVSEWNTLGDADLEKFGESIRSHFDSFPITQTPNESKTEDDLIWPILEALGWTESLRQQNLSPKGREDVPDGLLFESVDTKAKANGFPEEWKRYEFGRAVVESKRWARPLDRRSGRRGEETAPSTQMLRYLRRIDDITGGSLRCAPSSMLSFSTSTASLIATISATSIRPSRSLSVKRRPPMAANTALASCVSPT